MHRRTLAQTLGGAVSLSLLLVAAVSAQPRDEGEARELFAIGVEHFERGDLEAALETFLRSYRLTPRAKTLLNVGAVYRQLGRLADAANTYARYLAEPDAPQAQRAVVEERLAELDLALVRLDLQIDRLGDVSIDGVVLGSGPMRRVVRVTVGEHRITVGVVVTSVSGRAGEDVPVVVPVEAPPAPEAPAAPEGAPDKIAAPPLAYVRSLTDAPGPIERQGVRRSPRPWWIASGAVAVIAGGATGFLLWRQRDRLDQAEALGRADFIHDYSRARALEQGARDDAGLALVTGSTAGVLAAATVVLGLWSWRSASATPTIGVAAGAQGASASILLGF